MITESKYSNNGTLTPNKRLNQKKYDYKKRYGLTLEEVEKLKNQPCEICGVKAKKMCIDHNHEEPSTYRGVLCQQCNIRLGWLEKHLDVILEYKNNPPAKKGKK